MGAGSFWHTECIFAFNCGEQVGRAAEGPGLPPGGNAEGLVVSGNRASQCQAFKVKQGMQRHLKCNLVKLLSFRHILFMQNYSYTCASHLDFSTVGETNATRTIFGPDITVLQFISS